MNRILCVIVAIITVASSCGTDKGSVIERRLNELDGLAKEAQKTKDNLQQKSGTDYLAEHYKYYELNKKMALAAMRYLEEASVESLSRADLTSLLRIAKIAIDDRKVVEIAKTLFSKFPETTGDTDIVQTYFASAYMLEPEETEKYLNPSAFPPGDQLYCLYMTALGYAENGNVEKAREFYDRSRTLHASILADAARKVALPETYIASLGSFIQYKIGNVKEAFAVLEEAKKSFSDTPTLNQLDAFGKRLEIMEGNDTAIAYQNWIGTDEPIDLPSLKGKVVLLDFFAWNCETCTNGLENLKKLSRDVGSDDFVMIGVTRYLGGYENELNISEEREYELMKNHYYRTNRLDWPVCFSRTAMADFGVTSVPSFVLIGKTGKVEDGYVTMNYSYITGKIRELLNAE